VVEPVRHAHRYDEATGHLYDVTVKVMVELAFDKTPTEQELREAMLENVIDTLVNRVGLNAFDYDRDLDYEHVDEVALV